jgi:hypothetical protein
LRHALAHYEEQTEEDALAVVPKVREMIAKRQGSLIRCCAGKTRAIKRNDPEQLSLGGAFKGN